MSVVQVCARCAARWPVTRGPAQRHGTGGPAQRHGTGGPAQRHGTGGPAQWCPRCSGVLLMPARTDVYVPPGRRGFRWIARPPIDPRGVGDAPVDRSRPTPRYESVPQWGLGNAPIDRTTGPSRADRLAGQAGTLLAVAAALYGLAVLAELGRYAVLVRNRTTLIPQTLLTLSDATVYVTQVGGLLASVAAAAAAVCWLLRQRRTHYALAKESDPRTAAEVIVGCVVPILNLVMPAVYLLELVRRDPRGTLLVKIWWGVWASGALLLVVNAYWRTRPGLQAMADGVLLAAVIALVAAATAALTLAVIRRVERQGWRGRPKAVTRWVPAPPSLLEEKETAAT